MRENERPFRGVAASIVLGLALAPALARGADPDPAALAKAAALANAGDPSGVVLRQDSGGGVRHVQSGMVCVIGAEGMALARVEVATDKPAGEEVTCEYSISAGELSISAARLGDRGAIVVAHDLLAEIKIAHPDGQLASGPLIASYPGLPDPIAFSLAFNQSGVRRITSAWVSQSNGWSVIVKATYAADSRHDPELYASMGSIYARKSIQDAARH